MRRDGLLIAAPWIEQGVGPHQCSVLDVCRFFDMI